MTPEHYRVSIEGHRVLIAIVGEDTRVRLEARLHEVGARSIGPSAWLCDDSLSLERLTEAVGELGGNEIIYLAANAAERIDFGFLVAPRSEGSIIVT